MMRSPTRRSKKIGLTQGGRVKDGRAREKWSRLFSPSTWEQLSATPEGECRVFTENPSRDFYHPCTGSEYLAVLAALPSEYTQCVRAIVLRRTPKFDLRQGIDARRRYSCVIINAAPCSDVLRLDRPPTVGMRNHLGRWCDRWIEVNGGYELRWTRAEVRAYLLYHVFLHEIGHINEPQFGALRRREAFAENFALEQARRLGRLPPHPRRVAGTSVAED